MSIDRARGLGFGLALVSTGIAALTVGCGGGGETMAITEVSPDHGSARGGETITIAGRGFGDKPEVKLGGEAVTVKSAGASRIEVVAPRRIAGAVDVEVASGGERVKLARAYTYEPLPFTFVDTSWQRLSPFAIDGGNAVIADADGDGDADVFQAGRGEGVWVHPNDGKGTFGEPRAITVDGDPIDVSFVVARDFDGDGKVDLFLGTTGKTQSRLLRGKGKLAWSEAEDALPPLFGTEQSAVAVDLDDDGDLDLVVVGAATEADGVPGIVILSNNGKGHFTDVTAKRLSGGSFAATGVAVGDVDGDGDPDLFFGGAAEACRLYLNDGHGALDLAAPDALPYDPMPGAGIPALGDIDGDGSLDVYLPTATQDRILLNDGQGRFTDLTDLHLGPEAGAGKSAIITDLDLDGHADVLVVDRPGALRLYRNDGAGRLFDYSGEIAGAATGLDDAGVAIGDLDGDGDDDVFVSRAGLARAGLLMSFSPLPPKDQDEDGIPDVADNCPAVPNPTQENRDSLPFRCPSAAICAAETGCELHAAGGSTYLVCRTAAVTWGEASANCASRGGALVTISDAEENAFLVKLGVADAWIGYTDAATEGTYVWEKGESAFTNWVMGQPDDAGGNEDCATLGADGGWNDLPCDAVRPFVCEDLRAKEPDPGDACDLCPTAYEPGSEPVAEGAGTCGAGGGGAGGGGSGGSGP